MWGGYPPLTAAVATADGVVDAAVHRAGRRPRPLLVAGRPTFSLPAGRPGRFSSGPFASGRGCIE